MGVVVNAQVFLGTLCCKTGCEKIMKIINILMHVSKKQLTYFKTESIS